MLLYCTMCSKISLPPLPLHKCFNSWCNYLPTKLWQFTGRFGGYSLIVGNLFPCRLNWVKNSPSPTSWFRSLPLSTNHSTMRRWPMSPDALQLGPLKRQGNLWVQQCTICTRQMTKGRSRRYEWPLNCLCCVGLIHCAVSVHSNWLLTVIPHGFPWPASASRIE